MARNLLTGLLVRVHRWATMFANICSTLIYMQEPDIL